MYYVVMQITDVTLEDAGKYRVVAKNELGESNASISLNFDSKFCQRLVNIVLHFNFTLPFPSLSPFHSTQ